MAEAPTESKRQRKVMWITLLTPLVVLLSVVVGYRMTAAYRTPSCSWPLVVRGTATPTQIGLVRCYQEDLAHHDVGGLSSLTADGG